ncbi:MAG TPA: RDD family protein [Actinomycetota bacterium]|jgi:uncharacterized RDD family membrane protein YckC|nr:RDD family protein [Actinomycetota bacterium]
MADQPGGPPSYPAQQPVGSQQPVAPQEPAGYFMGRKLGGWGARVGAYLLDLIFVSVPTVILVAIAVIPVAVSSSDGGQPGQAELALMFSLLTAAFALQLVLVAYNRWYLQGTTGQSWGKRIIGLRLVRMADGQPVGGGMSFVRDVAHTIDGLICNIGYLMPLWDDRRQTIADKLLNTVVLDVR